MALAREMLSEGWQVRGTVRKKYLNVNCVVGAETFEISSLGSETDWSRALKGVDTVVHLAARTHVMREVNSDPLTEYRSINVAGTAHLASAASESGVKRFIYLSSIKVNGEGRKEPYTERDIPAPGDHYGISKWEAEMVLQRVHAETNMEVVIIRPPLVYGPGVKANFLQLIKIVNRGIPLPLSSVNNSRSVIYLGNLIDAIVACIDRPEAAGQTYLVSDGEDISTPELIRRVAAALGKAPRLFPCPPMMIRLAGKFTGRFAEVERLLGSLTVDTSKIQRELGWQAPYTLEQGLRETTEWFLKSQM
jgi:nucleoside-diphosphate-sugar epimerase